MFREIRLLWYNPGFELEGKYPGGYRNLALAKALIRNGVSHIAIASPLLKGSQKISENLELVALPHNPFQIWKSLRRKVASGQINVVQERLGFYYMWSGLGIVVGKQAGLPVVVELHECPFCFKDKLLQYLRLRYALKSCNKFLIVSNVIRQHIPLSKGEQGKIIPMPNGYDAFIASEAASSQSGFAEELVHRKRRVIGYFGALTIDKGVNVLLDLICSLENERFFFIIAGHGSLEYKVRAVQSRFPERLKFLGRIPQMDVYSLMSICDATLALYPYEIRNGCPQFVNPLKVYESLAVGTGVVISKIVKDALPAEIAKLCTVSKLNPPDILQAFESVCNKNLTQPTVTSQVVRNYSWDSIACRMLIPLYKQAVAMEGCLLK
jgi:glycosyltransferase involved in cell wall biosynthesis